MLSWKIGPAIATGNTVVLKTAEQTPLSALIFAELVKEAGFPPGVINILSGTGEVAGAAIANHMDIDKVAFTGSVEVGRKILRAAANSNLKKVTLELGGKSPNIIFNDANLDHSISWANWGVFMNAGQICFSSARIYVQAGIYEEFVERFKARINAQAIAVGDPFNQNSFYGPVVSKEQFDRVISYIEAGKAAGAVVQAGGGRQGDKGHFIQQTLFTNVTEDMSIVREEIFGPVAVVIRFETEEEAIRLANKTDFGLAACIHTKDLNTSLRVAHAIRAGTVWVNQTNASHWQIPTGGYKQSGIGRECGEEALANYTQTKAVSVRLGGPFFP
jgi:aldehyde dehydrogenase (NAD+)